MAEEKKIRYQIYCQKGKTIEAEFSADIGMDETEDFRIEVREKTAGGCRYGEICLEMKNESCCENYNLRMENPVRLYLPMAECAEKITAMYMVNAWWTRPAFVAGYDKIPDKTQVLFLQYKNRFSCLVPMVGQEYKAYLTKGTETQICLELTSGLGGRRMLQTPLYAAADALSLEEAIHKVFSWIAEYQGIRVREKRRLPEMFKYLGWCSWDAFYREVSEENMMKKAKELEEKKVPVRWMLIDDGWLSVQEEQLLAFEPDKEKFPSGFKTMVRKIREKGSIRWFGVWHTLGGYWGGILPGSSLDNSEHPYLCETVNGKLLPSPFCGEAFYRNWYRKLSHEGIDFVKVDGQSSVPYYFENTLPLAKAAKGMQEALEGGASYMDGAVMNCMGMAMENILARPTTAVSRNSDDFIPNKEDGFTEHLLQNAYNALYHNEIYCCDWDMFWTVHKDCRKHSLLRAVSGGPVYVSDRLQATDPKVLMPLVYTDGRILMMDHSAKPTQDCIFSDPTTDGVLKLHNTALWGQKKRGGGILMYNLTKQEQPFSFSPTEITGLERAEEYWIFNYFEKKPVLLSRDERYQGTLEEDGFAWFLVLPKGKNMSCLGLVDKYVGFHAVENMETNHDTEVVVIRETGTTGWIAERMPEKVMVNAEDVTNQVKQSGFYYYVQLPESASRMVLSIEFHGMQKRQV